MMFTLTPEWAITEYADAHCRRYTVLFGPQKCTKAQYFKRIYSFFVHGMMTFTSKWTKTLVFIPASITNMLSDVKHFGCVAISALRGPGFGSKPGLYIIPRALAWPGPTYCGPGPGLETI